MVTISLCMITKDEAVCVADAIKSVQDYVSEIIVVDSGSTDGTQDIVKSLGGRVYDFTWCDDFSAARNASLEHATGDWILVLDADEVIAKKDMEQLVALLERGEHDGYLIDQRNYTDDNSLKGWRVNDDYTECKSSGYHVSEIVRVFRNGCGYSFKNKVHEEVDSSIHAAGKSIGRSGVQVHHYGLLLRDIEEKRERYLRLGLAQIAENKNDVKAHYEVSRIYKARGDLVKAAEHLRIVIEKKPTYKQALTSLADCYREAQPDAARKLYHHALQVNNKDENAYNNLAILELGVGNIKEAVKVLRLGLKVNPDNPTTLHNLVGAYVKAKRPGEALKVCLRASDVTGLSKFKDTAKVLVKKLGVQGRVIEAMHTQEYGKAEELLRKLIQEKPDWHGYYVMLARMFIDIGSESEARAVLEEGLEQAEEKEELERMLKEL